jgi:hypothetical protein
MRNTILALAAATTAFSAVPVEAKNHRRDDRRVQYYQTSNGIQYWNGDDGRRYCRRPDGTTGLIVGAAAGALAGRAIDTRGERTTGTIIGAAAGALLGRHVERNVLACR